MEPKEETRKRVGHSPDRADAAALGYWAAVVRRPAKREVKVGVYTYSAPPDDEQPRGEPHEVFRHDELGKRRMGRRHDVGVW